MLYIYILYNMNSWIEHVKQYAHQNGLKYNEALQDIECKNSYIKGGSAKSAYIAKLLKTDKFDIKKMKSTPSAYLKTLSKNKEKQELENLDEELKQILNAKGGSAKSAYIAKLLKTDKIDIKKIKSTPTAYLSNKNSNHKELVEHENENLEDNNNHQDIIKYGDLNKMYETLEELKNEVNIFIQLPKNKQPQQQAKMTKLINKAKTYIGTSNTINLRLFNSKLKEILKQ